MKKLLARLWKGDPSIRFGVEGALMILFALPQYYVYFTDQDWRWPIYGVSFWAFVLLADISGSVLYYLGEVTRD